jgi:hypothetical protein
MQGHRFWKKEGKDGICIYIKAKDELAQEAKKLLAETPAKELKGEEGKKLPKAFQDEAEAAEAGMGRCLGRCGHYVK